MDTYFASFKRTVHPSDSGNKHFLLNACLLSRFSNKQGTNKGRDNRVKCKIAKVKQHVELQGCTVRLKEGSLIGQKTVDCILD